ncbi:MAG: hypothetical protein KDC59_03990 [Saprospiraceae bacterium]|nr:hypothetical protein [Saprospiraceae bacterium]
MDRAFGTQLIENFHQWIEIRFDQMPPSLRLFTHGVMVLWCYGVLGLWFYGEG